MIAIYVSIHAPTKGATTRNGDISTHSDKFQSTHPRRVRPVLSASLVNRAFERHFSGTSSFFDISRSRFCRYIKFSFLFNDLQTRASLKERSVSLRSPFFNVCLFSFFNFVKILVKILVFDTRKRVVLRDRWLLLLQRVPPFFSSSLPESKSAGCLSLYP